MRGPRRSAVNELDEASKKVYSPVGVGGDMRGVIGRTSTTGGSSASLTTVMEDEAGNKGLGSVLGIFAG